MRGVTTILALALLLAAFPAVPTTANDGGDADRLVQALANTPESGRAAFFAKLSSGQQKGVIDRLTTASITVSKVTTSTGKGPGLKAPYAAAGCWSTEWVVQGNSPIGIPLWKHHGITNWCSDGSVLTSASGYAYGTVHQVGWFYRGSTGHDDGGGVGWAWYERFDQSTFELCIIYCLQGAYPWTRIHDEASGSSWLAGWGG